ncbi:ECF transporter S component [Ligilactobacillus sp. Marseille-Q7487]|jgi:uncharacterized membrane protein|uniref:ECF transporter S component n=1 Tax=Ligilactobacillus sp. Marseille-Q7487 TaxID=3022128 RepID=UPI0015B59ED2|nr:ECF transporter S component [Ligilactobacillus sp. Marseille-Q7487]
MAHQRIYRLVTLALFGAVIIVQNFVPLLGYIPFGPLNITIIHVTVIIAAIVLGPKDGAIVGGIWGTITFVRAFVWPTSPLATIVFVNPLVSILPRILIGVVAGLVFKELTKHFKNKTLAIGTAAVLGSMVNTLLVLGQIYLFYHNRSQEMYALDVHALLPYLLGVVATNGIPEALLAGIACPLIALPLLKKVK